MTSKSVLKRWAVQGGIATRCPKCEKLLDVHTPYQVVEQDTLPKEGDHCICSGCLTILRFGPDAKSLRELTADEFEGLDPDVRRELSHALVAASAYKHSWGRA